MGYDFCTTIYFGGLHLKLLSIIAEYNPFHNGHAYHVNTSKEKSSSTHSMAIMSGNFLQRGEPALIDKWTRANMAVQNGLDLIVELPFVYSCQSAEIFAYGSIMTLNALNTVDTLSFGCEQDHLDDLFEIAKLLAHEPDDYKEILKNYLNQGHSYPKSRQLAVGDYLHSSKQILTTPNNILAIEYLKWLIKYKSSIQPLPIRRMNAGYHDENIVNNFVGATYIRNCIKKDKDPKSIYGLVPEATYNQLCKYSESTKFNHLDNYFSLIIGDLLKTTPDDLKQIFDVNEGLENRILKAIPSAKDMEYFIEKIRSKRYTNTRIKRILINFLLAHTRTSLEQVFNNPNFNPYLRVLAFNNKGKEILKEIKKNSPINIITNLSKDYNQLEDLQKYCIDKDVLATNYFYLMTDLNKLNSDFLKKPEII